MTHRNKVDTVPEGPPAPAAGTVRPGGVVTMAGTTIDTAGDAGEDALDTVVGSGALVLDAARRPGRAARRVRGRGARATDAIADQIEETFDDARALPERLLHSYLRAVRARARRRDPVGTVSQALLRAVHAPALEAAR